jgi:hypothetical protein
MNLSAQFEQKENNEKGTKINVPETYFGVLGLEIEDSGITLHAQHFVLTIDCSASMSDLVDSDGKTKMQHILFTVENMVRFFLTLENGPSVTMSIFAFDDSIHKILMNIDISTLDIDVFVNILRKKVYPMGSTNIELALSNAKSYVNTYMSANPSAVVTHLMMTDGDANCGSTNNERLFTYVEHIRCSTIIFGFGTTHNSKMLSYITQTNTFETAYYFIDQLENSGSVYGQALHKVLYNSVSNICITVENGKIYNWKTGEWTTQMLVGNAGAGIPKKYHIVTDDTSAIRVHAIGTLNACGEPCDAKLLQPRVELVEDLVKYKFRQQTLELLLKAKSVPKTERTECQLKLKNLFDEMTKYIADNGLEGDKFMKLLCDDVFIGYKTVGTKYGNMYANARQTSQGSQCVYNATFIPIDLEDVDIDILCTTMNYDDEEEEDEVRGGAIDACASIYRTVDMYNQPLGGYTVSQSIDTPYEDIRAISMMRTLTTGSSI